jgi:hypothetical protein
LPLYVEWVYHVEFFFLTIQLDILDEECGSLSMLNAEFRMRPADVAEHDGDEVRVHSM